MLKPVNDRLGHGAGDALLQGVRSLAARSIRGGDIACRYGSDELVLVLPEASRNATRKRAEKMREAVKGLELKYQKQPLGPVTISAGVELYPLDGFTSATMLKAADKGMYSAKQAGRDCVTASEPGTAVLEVES